MLLRARKMRCSYLTHSGLPAMSTIPLSPPQRFETFVVANRCAISLGEKSNFGVYITPRLHSLHLEDFPHAKKVP